MGDGHHEASICCNQVANAVKTEAGDGTCLFNPQRESNVNDLDVETLFVFQEWWRLSIVEFLARQQVVQLGESRLRSLVKVPQVCLKAILAAHR